MSTVPWTNDELLQQAQGNANALTAAALAYVRENGHAIEHFAAFVGDRFAGGWTGLNDKGALSVARATAFNPVSLGATLVSLDGDHDHASTVIDVSSPLNDAAAFGVSADDVATMWRVATERIADALGIRFAFVRNGSEWTFEFTR